MEGCQALHAAFATSQTENLKTDNYLTVVSRKPADTVKSRIQDENIVSYFIEPDNFLQKIKSNQVRALMKILGISIVRTAADLNDPVPLTTAHDLSLSSFFQRQVNLGPSR